MKRLILNLRPGIKKTSQYEAFKFPGGEVHFKLTKEVKDVLDGGDYVDIMIHARVNNSDSLMLLMLAVDAISATWINDIHVFIPYMPYQQADRKFSDGESFSLKTITRLLNTLPCSYTVFDPHSDVTPALLERVNVVDNSEFIHGVCNLIAIKYGAGTDGYLINEQLTLLSPDAGAYKKIFKLAEKLHLKCAIETANKYRDTSSGELSVRLSCDDFAGKDILIIDDICIGGRTFTALADVLKNRNVGRLFLAVSHGIFSNGLLELGRCFSDIFTTNSRRNNYEDMIKIVQDVQNQEGEHFSPTYNGLFQLHVFDIVKLPEAVETEEVP